jgi:integrase
VKGIKRQKTQAGEQVTQKEAAVTDILRQMVATLPDTQSGVHDRALLLLGFAGAFRRCELVALNMGDLKFTREGLVVTVRRLKTDQSGESRRRAFPTALTLILARCARCSTGWSWRGSRTRRPRHSGGRWTGTATSSPSAF